MIATSSWVLLSSCRCCTLDNYRPGAGGGVAPGVGGDVVDGVGRHLRRVDQDVAYKIALNDCALQASI